MSKRINLLLLYGGNSSEHEISLISAASVMQKLDSSKYRIIPVGMDKKGCLFENDYQDLLSYKEGLPVITKNSRCLPSLLVDGHLAIESDVVFPVVHGPLYEDGCLQGLLELANVAYVGCDVLASSIAMDKDMARRIVCIGGIRAANYRSLSSTATNFEREQFCKDSALSLGFPLFVKPCSLGSSVGIHKAKNMSELIAGVNDAFCYDKTILVEEFIDGREVELAVLENMVEASKPRVSVAGEISVNNEDGFYSYKAKYHGVGHTNLQIPANLEANLLRKLQATAADIFLSLKCTGMARVDFFVKNIDDSIYFNEINTLPGFTSISMYPKLWQASGIGYSDLLDELIGLAIKNHQRRQKLVTDYQ